MVNYITIERISEKKIKGFKFIKDKISIVISYEDGVLNTFSLMTNSFIVTSKIQLATHSPINSLHVEIDKLFTGQINGNVSIIQIDVKDNYYIINLERYFKSNFKISSLTYRREKPEIIIGDINGVLSFWNVYGDIIFSYKCNNAPITKILCLKDILCVSGKDKLINFFKLNDMKDQIKEKTIDEYNLEDEIAVEEHRLKNAIRKKSLQNSGSCEIIEREYDLDGNCKIFLSKDPFDENDYKNNKSGEDKYWSTFQDNSKLIDLFFKK